MPSLIQICGKEMRVTGRVLRVARLEADAYQFVDDPEPVLQELRASRTRVDLFTFMQRLPETKPKFSYRMEWDNFAALPVTTFDHWWNEQIGFKARNKAKQAEKRKVSIHEVPFSDELVKGIWEIYNESPIRQGEPNTHYGKNLETVYREEATFLDSSIFIGAYFEGSLIGFIKMVHDETRTQAGLMNIVSMIRHRDKAPTNALVAQAVKTCADRGFSYLVYSKFTYGKKRQSSLTEFKERNGFQQIDVPRYFVPLTGVGQLALGMGLHKKFTERLPEPLLAKLRELRTAWYSRKSQSVTEAS
ncbi:MAG: hypothetical protein WA664_06410 [Candidatus Acidiferrales bacterium]